MVRRLRTIKKEKVMKNMEDFLTQSLMRRRKEVVGTWSKKPKIMF